jgi:hypothetical protein
MRTHRIFIILIALLTSHCAYVLTGTKQRMRIVTREPGAEVWHNNQLLDTTPCIIRIQRSYEDQQPIMLKKPGYETQSIPLKRKFNELAALNFILPVNWFVDGITSSIIRYGAIDTVAMKRISE